MRAARYGPCLQAAAFLVIAITVYGTGPAAAFLRIGGRGGRETAVLENGVFGFRNILGGGGGFPGVKAQKFHNLGFDLIAQVDVFVQQGTHLFAALAQLFCAEGEP